MPDKRSECEAFIYPPEYENCPESEAWKFNYGLIHITKINVERGMFVSVVCDFDEIDFRRRIAEES